MQCDLKITKEYLFKEIETGIVVPTISLQIHREGMKRSIVTDAIIDTGMKKDYFYQKRSVIYYSLLVTLNVRIP